LLIRIATRKSALALWQAEHVAERLQQLDEVNSVELVPLSTRGDEILDRSLQKIGGKGLFIKELEVAMQQGDADIAVHSMKDVPAEMPEGFCVAAVLDRASHADAFVSTHYDSLDALPEAARVGSSSLRRQAQLRMMRPDLVIEPLRGNVNTRLAKLEAGEYDAIILAAAGLERLGLQQNIRQQFETEQMLPAAAQGVIGTRTTAAERAVALTLQANCQSPVAAFATIAGDRLRLTALVALPDGSRSLRDSREGPAGDAEQIGRQLAVSLLEQGAGELLEQAATADG
jgi:hydroxymethylbilane synthase